MPRFVFPIAVTLVALIGYCDYSTGYEVSLFVFYALPILLVVWFADRGLATLVALLSALVWWWADAKSGHLYLTNIGEIWETGVRLAFFFFIVLGGAAMKGQHDAVAEELRAAQRERGLEREIVLASEREQQRIGQDLHDGLCQVLAAICCAANSLQDDLRVKNAPEARRAGDIEVLLCDAIKQARNISRGIAPVHLDESGFVSALEELASHTTSLTDVECAFSSSTECANVDPHTATHLYRIVQEALNNALKHSGARRIAIDLVQSARALTLQVRDDGRGLAPGSSLQAGMGMRTMRYRARVIGGELQVSSGADGGTSVTCALPIRIFAEQNEPALC